MSERAKNPGGRPRKYTMEVLDELAISLKKWVKHHADKNEFCLLNRWCFDNDFNPRYFTLYANQHEGFKDAYEFAKDWQEYSVTYGALKQTLNARFAQFFLGCCHKWRTVDADEGKLAELRNEFGKFIDHLQNKVEDEIDD